VKSKTARLSDYFSLLLCLVYLFKKLWLFQISIKNLCKKNSLIIQPHHTKQLAPPRCTRDKNGLLKIQNGIIPPCTKLSATTFVIL